jgi:hypothetical protein
MGSDSDNQITALPFGRDLKRSQELDDLEPVVPLVNQVARAHQQRFAAAPDCLLR